MCVCDCGKIRHYYTIVFVLLKFYESFYITLFFYCMKNIGQRKDVQIYVGSQ